MLKPHHFFQISSIYDVSFHIGMAQKSCRGIIVAGGESMRLKMMRKEKGLTQTRLAIELNTSQNTISRYETGEREPGIRELIKIADYFNVSIDYLLERSNNPKLIK